ncbi:hypothetical protein ACL6C3_06860 [Capilliphycus salinus ALCB114379]|uniref:hypothetical protein n=1 Tax=Capilliphycus salinus TaxID=2768948 RepID=UPI0039A64029
MVEQSNQPQIIDVKKAVFAARNYLQSLETDLGGPFQDLLLEETELTDDRNFWLITLGFNHQIQSLAHPLGISYSKEERKYKILKVNAETGEVESMKIREL